MPDDLRENGIVHIQSKHSVDDTVSHLQQMLEAQAVKIFAIVDHSGEAEKVGLRMLNTKLVIFGNPKAGTPLMLAAPTIALDLPLRILVWEDHEARVWVTYNDPEFLGNRHHLPLHLMGTLTVVGRLADEIAH
ncbi:MAG: DUF302 domain-containing protein [Acidobacteriaceae bacterium]|nr:DUF302 domain-containing protein [Acidobacteriaceae bacterium]